MADDASEDTSAVEANTFEKDAGLCSCEGGVDCSVSYALTLPILVGLQELRLGLSMLHFSLLMLFLVLQLHKL